MEYILICLQAAANALFERLSFCCQCKRIKSSVAEGALFVNSRAGGLQF